MHTHGLYAIDCRHDNSPNLEGGSVTGYARSKANISTSSISSLTLLDGIRSTPAGDGGVAENIWRQKVQTTRYTGSLYSAERIEA